MAVFETWIFSLIMRKITSSTPKSETLDVTQQVLHTEWVLTHIHHCTGTVGHDRGPDRTGMDLDVQRPNKRKSVFQAIHRTPDAWKRQTQRTRSKITPPSQRCTRQTSAYVARMKVCHIFYFYAHLMLSGLVLARSKVSARHFPATKGFEFTKFNDGPAILFDSKRFVNLHLFEICEGSLSRANR